MRFVLCALCVPLACSLTHDWSALEGPPPLSGDGDFENDLTCGVAWSSFRGTLRVVDGGYESARACEMCCASCSSKSNDVYFESVTFDVRDPVPGTKYFGTVHVRAVDTSAIDAYFGVELADGSSARLGKVELGPSTSWGVLGVRASIPPGTTRVRFIVHAAMLVTGCVTFDGVRVVREP